MSLPALSPGLKQTQKLIITQELRESLDILQMPVAELQTYLTEQLDDNCLLERKEAGECGCREADGEPPGDLARHERDDENVRLESLFDNRHPDWLPEGFQPWDGAAGPEAATDLWNSLQDYLLFQLHLAVKTPREEEIGRYLIGNIDADGYLRCAAADAASDLGVAPQETEQVLALIQSFDPCGVGARDLAECLRLQLLAMGTSRPDEDACQTALGIIENYLDDLAERKLAHIAARLKKPAAGVRRAVNLILRLEPKPGKNYGQPDSGGFLVPDAFIKKSGKEFLIWVNEPEAVHLKVNPAYRDLLNKSWLYDPETVDYIRKKLKKALRLLKNIGQRHLTLQRICETLLALQRPFFSAGDGNLKPLTLREVALVTGLHESTVSRCIDGKYLETPRGTFPLKYFFSHSVSARASAPASSPMQGHETEAASATVVKNMIKTIVEAESKNAPWSDQQLAEILKERGIHISRRTVAKYREAMRIPSSSLRRSFS